MFEKTKNICHFINNPSLNSCENDIWNYLCQTISAQFLTKEHVEPSHYPSPKIKDFVKQVNTLWVPLDVQGRVLPFWKPLINIFKEPECHGCCSTLNISQAMQKIAFFLVSYYKRLKTNAQNCIKSMEK